MSGSITYLNDSRQDSSNEKDFLEYLRQFMEALPEAIFLSDSSGRILEANGVGLDLFGYAPNEIRECKIENLIPGQISDKRLNHVLQDDTQKVFGGMYALAKDGTEFASEMILKKIEIASDYYAMIVVRNLEGQRDLEKTSMDMENLGRLASGIIHDFNNKIGIIMLIAGSVLEELEDSHFLKSRLQQIYQISEQSGLLTRQLLTLGRQASTNSVALNFNHVIQNFFGLLERVFGENIQLQVSLDSELVPVKISEAELDQIFMNLCLNARDAMPRGGELTITTKNVFTASGPQVLLRVGDTGQGMDAETKERIFEPYFSTKEKDRGTGLGLPTIQRIVQQNGGTISVSSQENKGTTFEIYFPSCEKRQKEVIAGAKPIEPPREAMILVVEDDQMLRDLMAEALQRGGYQVATAESGPEGLELARKHQGGLDLVLTDVVMPEMDGRVLAGKLMEMDPKLSVVFISGHPESEQPETSYFQAGSNYIEKPVRPQHLLEVVRETLEASSGEQAG